MTRTTVNGKDILVVWFPERISPTIADNRVVGWKSGDVKYYSEELPVGQWEVVLDTAEAEEKDYDYVIGGEVQGLFPYGVSYTHLGTPKEWFYSFLVSLNLPTDKRYIVLQNKKA